MGGGELWSSTGRRGAAALALIAVLALVVSAAAGASAVRDGVPTAALAASCGTDEFDGSALDDVRWDVLRPAAAGVAVGGGKLSLTLRTGDLISGTANAENVVLQEAPAGGWTATTKLNVAALNAQGEQAGLVLWRGEGTNLNTFGKVMFNQIDAAGAKVVESIWTDRSVQVVPTADSRAALPSPLPTEDVLLRLRYDGVGVTAEYSLDDGATWTQAGQAVSYRGTLKVGVMAIQGATGDGGVVPFERFDLECAPHVTASASSGPAPLEVSFTSTAEGAWDFGDGTTGAGASVNHTFTEPGTYRVRQTVGDLTGSTVVTVQPDPAALPQSDEFEGNELDPKWEVLRPRDTWITVSGGHLRVQQSSGDMHGTNSSASNVLLQSAPQGCAWTAETRIDVSAMTATGDQAGLILWRSESPHLNYSKVIYNRRANDTWWVERSNTNAGAAAGTANTALPNIPAYIYIRVKVAADGLVQPERSTDGTQWTPVGAPYHVADYEPLKVGLAFFGSNSVRRAAFDYFRVTSEGPCVPPPACPELSAPEQGFAHIWDGRSLDGWRQAGPGTFALVNDGAEGCRLETHGGLGLLWYELAQYDDFVLRLQFRTEDDTDNSGVFVRFPNPGADANLPISQGHEIQIREGVAGDGEDQKTGSIYGHKREEARNAKPAGEWNDYEIKYENNSYTITLNGQVVNTWTPAPELRRTPGHIGLQNHGDADRVSFRNIRIQHIGEPYQPNLFTTFGITSSDTRANSEIRGNPPYSLPAEEMPPSGTRGPAPEDTFDEVPLRMPDTSGTARNLAAFRGQTLPLRPADQRVYSKIHFFGTTSDGNGGGDFTLRFSDGSKEFVTVAFDDWCGASQTAAEHIAIGPLSQRYRANGGQDGARCSIYHAPADVTSGKTLVSVTLPRATSSGSGGNRQAYLMALTLEEPGGGFRSPDLSGQVQFADDQTAPVSQHVVTPGTPSGSDGWYRESVSVTLSAADEPGGSDLQRIQYRLNGGVPQDYAGTPVTIADDGAFTFEYRAIDKAGNAEGYKPVPIKVDRTAPATGVRVEPEAPRTSATWDDRPATVTLTARDGSGSGIAATEYHLGDGNWRPYSGTISLDADGRYVLHARSRDVAGNAETVQVVDIGIDQTAPTSTAQLTSAEPRGGGVHRAPVTVTLGAADAQSGVSTLEYRLDGGQWQAYGGPFTVSSLGAHILEYRARDHAGNLENAREATFAIGTTSMALPDADDSPLPPEPFVGLMPVNRVRVGALLRGDLRVRAACVAVGRGRLALTVSRKVARRLGLGRRTTLASRTVRCGDESRVSVSLKPGRRVKRALRRADGPFAARLRLRMNGADGPAADSEKLTLRG